MFGSDAANRRWLEVDGRLLHRLEFGASGRRVVCLHGVTSCAWVWHHVARGLAATGRSVVACDLRGHGDSAWAEPDGYATWELAQDLAAVLEDIDDTGDGPADIVGNSWGGLVGLALAAQRPELVRRLVLVDVEPSFSQPVVVDPPRPGQFATVEDAVAFWRSLNPSAPDDLLRLLSAAASRPAADGARVALHDPLFLRCWPFRSEDWWAALEEIDAPTLVVKAERGWVRSEVCDEMADKLRHGQRLNIPGAAHTVPVDAPRALTDVLSQFLSS